MFDYQSPTGGSYGGAPYSNSEAIKLCMHAHNQSYAVNEASRIRASSSPIKRPALSANFSFHEEPFKKPYTPFAPRSTTGYSGAGAFVANRSGGMPSYSSLEDPFLAEYFERKFGQPSPKSLIWHLHGSSYNGDQGMGLRRSHSANKLLDKKSSRQVVYKVAVTTADLKGAGTTAPAFITLRGDYGSMYRSRLIKKSGTSQKRIPFKFSPGSTHIFKIVSKDLGELKSIVIEHTGIDEDDSWLVQNVEVFNMMSKKTWMFICNHWLSLYKEDGQVSRELFGLKCSKTKYEIVTVTSDMEDGGSTANVFITLYGKTGITPKIQLPNDDICFTRGKSDRFVIKAPCVGPITKVRLEHDNGGDSPGWLPERLVVTDMKHPKWKFFFNCGEWLSKDHGDGSISRDFMGSRDPMGLAKTTEYRITVYTGNKKGAGTDADVSIILFGENGTSREEPLRGPFKRSGINELVSIHKKQLGPLVKIKLGHDNTGFSPGWFVEKIIIDDVALQKVYQFPCNLWFDIEKGDGLISRELFCKGSGSRDGNLGNLDGCPYEIKLFTGDKPGAATSARIYLVMYGPEKSKASRAKELCSGRVWIGSGTVERNKINISRVTCPELVSPLTKLEIGHDDSGSNPSWYLEKVIINCPITGIHQTFICNDWLSRDKSDKKIERTLFEDFDSRQMQKLKIPHLLTICTSDIPMAGTDAKVTAVLYGANGKTDDIVLADPDKKLFERNSVDRFPVDLEDVGLPYKLRIGHDNSGSSAGWHLDRVLLQNLQTNEEFSFKCGRWMSVDEEDHSICRELPAIGPGIKKPATVHNYRVQVMTGSRPYAGTDANVFINIFGEFGDTGERFLTHSAKHANKFEKGNTDDFVLEAVRLGKLSKIRIGHDAALAGSGWYLDKVIVEDLVEREIQNAFECFRWFDIKEDDGLIVRELTGSTMLDKITYEVCTVTGNVPYAGTDANVFIRIFGSSGDTGNIQLKSSDAAVNKFERGRNDLFKVESADIGEINKIRVSHDGAGPGAGWYLKEVSLTVPHHGKRYVFACNRWLDEKEEDHKLEVDLEPTTVNDIDKTIPYEVTVYTGDVKGAGTDANVFLQIYGTDNKKTEKIALKNKSNLFERNYTDKIKVNGKDVGPITKIRIGHDGEGAGAGWFLDKVKIQRIVPKAAKKLSKSKSINGSADALPIGGLGSMAELNRDQDARKRRTSSMYGDGDKRQSRARLNSALSVRPGSRAQSIPEVNEEEEEQVDVITGQEEIETYWFLCNRWLARSEDDKAIVRELLPTDEEGNKLSDLDELEYTVAVKTSNIRYAGTDANVFITLYGDLGDSGERGLENSSTNATNKFEKNSTDVFKIKCIELGKLKKVKIRHDNKGGGGAWHLEHVTVKDPKSGTEFCFPCNRWLAIDEDDGMISRELIPVTREAMERMKLAQKDGRAADELLLEKKNAGCSYQLFVRTGSKMGSGTDANVFIILYGDENDSGEIALKNSQTFRDKFEAGQEDIFILDAIDVGEVKKIKIFHDNSGPSADWFLDYVEVACAKLGLKWKYPCNSWLSKSKGDGQLFKELYPQLDATEEFMPCVPYEITTYTSNLGSSGTSANVYVQIYGVESCTRQAELCSKKERGGKFKKGAVDKFVLELEDVGDRIEKLRIGHDNSGFSSGWHLEKVEVRRLQDEGSVTYIFPCNKWLARDEGDSAIERELVPNKMFEETSRAGGQLKRKESTYESTLKLKSYKVKVYTGDVKGAGTDANVFCTVFGEKGDSGERKLAKSETYSDKFERNHEDIFTWECADLGKLTKLRIRHDNSGLTNASWYLNHVEVEDTSTKEKFVFHCERWLSKDKEDKKLERVLREENYTGDLSSSGTLGSGSVYGSRNTMQSRQSIVGRRESGVITRRQSSSVKSLIDGESISYTVRVQTGFEKDMGSDGPLWINIFGEKEQSTGVLMLDLYEKKRFEPGSVETISLEALDVGVVDKIEVGNDGVSGDSGWFLDEIKLSIPVKGVSYRFTAKAWFDKEKQDGRVVRKFYVNKADQSQMKTFKPKISYEISVITGNVDNAGTDCLIGFQLFGDQGSSPEYHFDKVEDRFERNKTDLIKMDLEDVGMIKKLRIWHDNKGSRKHWYLDEVQFRNMKSFDLHVFKYRDFLSTKLGTRKVTSVDLPAIYNNKEQLSRTNYKVYVKTSNVTGAGTDANVYIKLYGENGDSGDIHLKTSLNNKDPFENDQNDEFDVPNILDLGNLARCRVWHDNKGIGAAWHLEYIEVHDTRRKRKYMFKCNKWLSKNEDDRQISRDLKCEGAPGEKKEMDSSLCEYEIEVITSDKENAGMVHNAWIIVIGNKAESPLVCLKNGMRDKVLRRGQSDIVKTKGKSLGDIKKIMLGAFEREDKPLGDERGRAAKWHCEAVHVRDIRMGHMYEIPVREWIDILPKISKRDAKEFTVDLIKEGKGTKNLAQSLRMAENVVYEIVVYTGDQDGAGTNANVLLTIFGENGDSGKRPLSGKGDLFERKQVDRFQIECMELGELSKIKIEHDNSGFRPDWFLDRVEIINQVTSYKYEFECKQWLSEKKGNNKTWKILDCSN